MRRLFAWLLVAFSGVVLLSTLTRTVSLSIALKQWQQDESTVAAMADARTVADWARDRWEREPADLRPGLSALGTVAGARIWLVSAQGTVRVDTGIAPSWEGVTLPPHDLAVPLRGETTLMRGRSPWLESALAAVVPVIRSGQVIGVVFFFVPSTGWLSDALNSSLFWTAVIAFSVAGGASYFLSRRFSRPLEQITHVARQLGQGEFTGPIRISSYTEVTELAETFNRMSARLRESFTALSAEQQRLAAIVESMQEGVVAINGQGELFLANAAATRLLRWEQKPAMPSPQADLMLPRRLAQALADAARGETVEVNLRLSGDSDLLAICFPLPAPEGGTGAAAVLRDLEAIMRLQRMRENLVADVAHELRGPLANLNLIAEAFGDGTIPWEDRSTYVDLMQSEIARLNRLSRDVLDLARMDAGTLTIQPEPVNLLGLATSVAARLAARANAAQVEVTVDVPVGLVAVASWDRMEQVLINLTENALRHTPPGGQIRVEGFAIGDQVCLRVTDTGSGIPAAHLPHIFERFYKVDPSRTRTEAGTGLGLAVVRQLVELQGGTVEASSQEGVGSAFLVRVPRTS